MEDAVTVFDWYSDPITRKTPITASYRNTQNVRRFFQSQCGAYFKFDRPFMEQCPKDHGRRGRRMEKAQADSQPSVNRAMHWLALGGPRRGFFVTSPNRARATPD
jgi:hypothetical protein